MPGSDEIAEVDRAFHEMATSLDQQKQENEMFVYSVSHDLRSPLINLQGFSEELSLSCRDLQALFRHAEIPPAVRDDGLKLMTENIEESIRYIQTAVGRLARIIDALLRLSRAGRVEYQWQTLDHRDDRPTRSSMPCTTRLRPRKPRSSWRELPPAWGDPTAVEQIFANLISNAVHYLDAARSGTIEVGSTRLAARGHDGRASMSITSRTTVWAFPRHIISASSPPSAGCTRTWRKGKASAWPWSAAWSSGTAARSGWSRRRGSARRFLSPCRPSRRAGDSSPVPERPTATQAPKGEQPAWQPSRS